MSIESMILEFVSPQRFIDHIFELSVELHGIPMDGVL